MLKLKIQRKKSSKCIARILLQIFELTACTLNTGFPAFDGIIDNTLQHRKRNSVNVMHYIRRQVLKSRRLGEYTRSLRYPHNKS